MRFPLSEPAASQIKRRLASAFKPQSVRGQPEAGDVRIKVTRRKVLVLNLLEQNSVIHAQTICVRWLFVNRQASKLVFWILSQPLRQSGQAEFKPGLELGAIQGNIGRTRRSLVLAR